MAGRLIINADDFGLTPGINRAVAELYRAGVLSSATLMANGGAFEDAIAIAHEHAGLGVGCHVVLTDGVPVSNPTDTPTLVAPGSKALRPTLAGFVRALLAGRIREADIAREALAQIRTLQCAGVRVTHVDTHKHTHLFPTVLRPLLAAAKQAGVPAVRSPFEPRWADRLGHGTVPRRAAVRISRLMQRRFSTIVKEAGLRTTDGTLAISATGELTAATLEAILSALPSDGTFELCCHPGYNDGDLDRVMTRLRKQRETEREALLNVVPRLLAAPGAPQLVHYGALSVLAPSGLAFKSNQNDRPQA